MAAHRRASLEPGARWLERTLGRLVEHVRALVPADGVAVAMVDPDSAPIGWASRPELLELLQVGGRGSVAGAVLQRDRPLLLPAVEAWEAAPGLRAEAVAALGDARGRRAWTLFGGASLAACPVRSELGRPLGVLVVVSLDREAPLDGEALRTVEVLAALAAMAVERAALLEAEAGRARDEQQLGRAMEAVSASLEPDEVQRRIAEHAVCLTGADESLLSRASRRAGDLHAVAGASPTGALPPRRDASGAAEDGWRAPVLARAEDGGALGGALARVARTRAPLLDDAPGGGSLMHAPIELGARLYGVLSVAHGDPDRFGAPELEMLAKLARSSAAALANAIDFDRERRIARALTLGFVPASLPEMPGFATGLLYAPALGEPAGGDIYGAWPLPGGDVALLVGDVAGKGVETAALSAMVRFFVEARSWDERSPAAVLAQANAMLCTRLPSDTFVTAFLGVLSADGLRYCNAGHLPPLLVSGQTRPLQGHGLPLGIHEGTEYGESELRLAAGDLVFAYTDGLVEARRGSEMYGHKRLGTLVEGWARALAPEELVSAVHEEVAGWADLLGDDVVALALRRRG